MKKSLGAQTLIFPTPNRTDWTRDEAAEWEMELPRNDWS
jgi:hypothetical protein